MARQEIVRDLSVVANDNEDSLASEVLAAALARNWDEYAALMEQRSVKKLFERGILRLSE
jgi:hypothetical protein